MRIPTPEEIMKAFDHKTLAERVIVLELAFGKLMATRCSLDQSDIIKNTFPVPPIGHAWGKWPSKKL